MKDSTVRTVRTVVQSAIAVAAVMPVLLSTLGVGTASGVGASLIAAAAVVTRLHAIPAVSDFLAKYLKIPNK